MTENIRQSFQKQLERQEKLCNEAFQRLQEKLIELGVPEEHALSPFVGEMETFVVKDSGPGLNASHCMKYLLPEDLLKLIQRHYALFCSVRELEEAINETAP